MSGTWKVVALWQFTRHDGRWISVDCVQLGVPLGGSRQKPTPLVPEVSVLR